MNPDTDERFEFGANWARFLRLLDDGRISEAEKSLQRLLGRERLDGVTFLDIGSGSGLFSLAARRLGAAVTSFDYDTNSVACTSELRRRYYTDDPDWKVMQGSVLDEEFMKTRGSYDIVYSWGVLHHTGSMWQALANAGDAVRPGGVLCVAIYNDQGWKSRAWTVIKRTYVKSPEIVGLAMAGLYHVGLQSAVAVRDLLRGRPFATWRTYRHRRGMSPWHDAVDWVGGYPFEVASAEAMESFYAQRGFTMERQFLVGGKSGCNEFVLRRKP